MQASIPELKYDVIKSLTFLRLLERHQAILDELHMLMRKLLMVITDMNALESEFPAYQAITDDEFPVYFDEDDKHIWHIWHQISKQIDLYSGRPRFKYLVEFAKFLLLISHSNSYCESVFSSIARSALMVAIT